MGSEELSTNLFRITQTEAKLKNDKINTQKGDNTVHYEVGKEIRNTIEN